MSDRALESIEVAKTTGKIRKGVNEVTKAIEKGLAKLVVVAKDVSPPELIMHLQVLCQEKNVPFVEVKTREELGVSAGLSVPTAAVAIVQEGEAKNLIKSFGKA